MARSASKILKSVSSPVWFVEKECPEVKVYNYIDNFILIAVSNSGLVKRVECFISTCERWGLPINEKKTVFATNCSSFLLIDIVSAQGTGCAMVRIRWEYNENMIEFPIFFTELPSCG